MESIRTVASTLQGGELLVSIDIKDAYLHIPTFPDHQKLLRIEMEQHHNQFVVQDRPDVPVWLWYCEEV